MKQRTIAITVAIIGLLLTVPWTRVPAQLSRQESTAHNVPNDIFGFWTEIYNETEGENFSSISAAATVTESPQRSGGIYWPALRRFAKEKSEVGPNRQKLFPQWEGAYKLNVGGQKGAIDFISLDKKHPGTAHGIYLVKDDLLILCAPFGEAERPKRFASTKNPRTSLTIYRRGKVLPFGFWGGRQDRLAD